MRRFTGIEESTGHDYDADRLAALEYSLASDAEFCEAFAKAHACDLCSMAFGIANDKCKAVLTDAWATAVRDHAYNLTEV